MGYTQSTKARDKAYLAWKPSGCCFGHCGWKMLTFFREWSHPLVTVYMWDEDPLQMWEQAEEMLRPLRREWSEVS